MIAVLISASCTTTHEAMPDAYAPIDARRPNPDTNADVTHVPYMRPDATSDAVPFPDAIVYRRLDETGWCGESGGYGCVDPDEFACGCYVIPDSPTVCVDTSTDDANCGGCGIPVPLWAHCRDGYADPQPLADFWEDGRTVRVRERSGVASWTVLHDAPRRRLDEDLIQVVPYVYLTRDGRALTWWEGELVPYAIGEAATAVSRLEALESRVVVLGRSGRVHRVYGSETYIEPIEHVAQVHALMNETIIARREDGRISARGYVLDLGIGAEALETYVDLPLAGPATDLACAGTSCCAALADETVWCWGRVGEEIDDTTPTPLRIDGVDGTGGLLVTWRHSCTRSTSAPGGIVCWRGSEHPFADLAPRTPTLVRATESALCAWFEDGPEHGSIECESWGRSRAYVY